MGDNTNMFDNATAPLTFHNFLDRMRDPSAADLVRSIKNFISKFLSNPPDPERDSQSVQEFLAITENAFKAHPLWAGATAEELESSGEGLEKYLMTKLFSRAFASLPEDAEQDQQLSEKMTILQEFIRPEHLDIPKNSQNETSWLLAQKELQKINTYKAPRDKLVCILNCCRVINNLLVNVTMASNENPPGADDFLPVLIYVVIKANPPQLHSNLLYIQRYRHEGRLVSEAAYFYTNLVSAESFIKNLDSSSLTVDPVEFEKKMEAGRERLEGANRVSTSPASNEKGLTATELTSPKRTKSPSKAVPSTETDGGQGGRKEEQSVAKGTPPGVESATEPVLSVEKLEAGAAAQVLEADKSGQLSKDYPFLYSSAGDLRVMDVESLLHEYKELVLRYVALRKAVESSVISEKPAPIVQKQDAETQDAVPLQRDESVVYAIPERTESISQPPGSSISREEISGGELPDSQGDVSPSEGEVVAKESPKGNATSLLIDAQLKDLHPDKTKPTLPAPQNLVELGDAEDVSDLQVLETRDSLPDEVVEEKSAESTELEPTDDAEISEDKSSDTAATPEGTAETQSRLEEHSSPS